MLTSRQIEAVGKLSKAHNGIVWWKIGEGKTRIALAWATDHMRFNDDKALVVCSPNAIRQWQDEANLFGFTRLEFLSYGELQSREIHLANLPPMISCVIVDELWLFKNPKATRSRNLHKLTTTLPTLGLSGSLVTARNIEDLFGQAYAVNAHKSLAKSLTEFRTQFCVSVENYGGLKFWAKAGALETIQRRLAPSVDVYFPPAERESKTIPITVNPTPQQQRHLTDVNSEYFTLLDTGQLEIRSAAVLISKVQQISDGAVHDSEGHVAHIPSNKLQRCIELCHQLAEADQRVLVWCAFKASVDLIASCLGKEATTLSSHTDFDYAGWGKGRYKFCIATVGSGASLNDFTNVQYSIVYSAPYNHRAIQQAFGRTNRKGSQHSIAYYYMMQTAETVDESVYRNLKLTADIEQSIIATSAQVIRQYMQHYTHLTQPTLTK
jgi:hypothetical protein